MPDFGWIVEENMLTINWTTKSSPFSSFRSWASSDTIQWEDFHSQKFNEFFNLKEIMGKRFNRDALSLSLSQPFSNADPTTVKALDCQEFVKTISKLKTKDNEGTLNPSNSFWALKGMSGWPMTLSNGKHFTWTLCGHALWTPCVSVPTRSRLEFPGLKLIQF